MGQATRIARSSRFISEFADLVHYLTAWKPGEALFFESSHFAVVEGRNEEVSIVLVFRSRSGDKHEFEGEIFFDPEEPKESIVEHRHAQIDLTAEEFEARLRKADLL